MIFLIGNNSNTISNLIVQPISGLGYWFRKSFSAYLLGKTTAVKEERNLNQRLIDLLLGLVILIAVVVLLDDMLTPFFKG